MAAKCCCGIAADFSMSTSWQLGVEKQSKQPRKVGGATERVKTDTSGAWREE